MTLRVTWEFSYILKLIIESITFNSAEYSEFVGIRAWELMGHMDKATRLHYDFLGP